MIISTKEDKTRVNEKIRAPEVRVVQEDGEMLGVMTPAEAMEKAFAMGLDLVEISPNATPPVCKILDYGKFKYQLQKKANEAKKKQKVIELKEIKLRPNIDDHDFEVKMKKVKQFFDEGNKVKITLRFRGREMAHIELGQELMNRVKEMFAGEMKVENEPKLMGRQMIMVMAPEAKKS